MKELEDRIRSDGVIIGGDIVKVDSFINHQIDTVLLNDICAYLAHPFHNIDKVLTIETSGIAFAIGTAQQLGNIPMVFAKKSKSKIVDETNLFLTSVKSFTRGTVSMIGVDKRFLKKGSGSLSSTISWPKEAPLWGSLAFALRRERPWRGLPS